MREDFDSLGEGAAPSGWRVVAGRWRVEKGELVAGDLDGEVAVVLPGGPRRAFRLDLEVRFLEVKESSRWLGVRFGSSVESAPYHQVTLRRGAEKRNGVEHAFRRRGGEWTVRVTGSTAKPLGLGLSHRLRLESGGGRVRVFVDGERVLDSPLAGDVEEGEVGLAVSSARIALDDVTLRNLRPEEVREMAVPYGPLREVVVIAHRGASAEAPENTRASLRLALEQGAPAAEFDVYRSRDGEVVLLHDHDVRRTTNFREVFPAGKDPDVSKLLLSELRRLDAGSWKSPRFRGELIPTLRETLRDLKGKMTPVVEIKPDDIGPDVARVIREEGMQSEVFVQSFSARALREFRRELPEATTGFLTGKRVSVDEAVRARRHLENARRAGANAVVCHFSLVGPTYVKEMHRHAISVWVYTVNDPALWDLLIRLGVDGIVTDVPGEASSFLKEHARR
ncbi:MAG: glycerophosphodiester phosphodiesterase family protein [Planctomycetota bacterium]|nr:glycerophosphodiester phosphodiesterase family protein [Planctomycetota bacterium]